MASSRVARHLAGSAVAFTALAAIASCGSRTGLFGPEDTGLNVQAPDPFDGGRDARSVRDAIPDVIEEPLGCIPGTFTFALATPQLMFVLDRSGSMEFQLTSNTPSTPSQPSRWSVLASSLGQTITPFTNQIAMGARFFPSAEADDIIASLACMQDPPSSAITPALGNAASILSVFTKTFPIGGTPTAIALQRAAQEVSSSRAVARVMVLATDGQPNCNAQLDGDTCICTSANPDACRTSVDGNTSCLDDNRTVQTIRDIYDQRKIPVYVVGIGATAGFAPILDRMATAGGRPRNGTPKYYAADTPAQLTNAFTVIRDGVARCSYITPSSPTDPNAITVELGGKVLLRDPTHTDGWDWIDQAYGHLQLFGSACDQANASNVAGTVTCGDQ